MNKLQQLSFNAALFNFLLVGLVGVLLRWLQWQGSSIINYHFLLSAHSHFAMGGWMFTALFSAILVSFPVLSVGNKSTYNKIFWLSQTGNYGMLFTFPFKGYGLVSITFSELYVIATYWFAYRVWNDIDDNLSSAKWLKAALIFLLISSLGPYAVGPMMANQLSGSVWYYDAIYFYLHFQYNGWFTFAVLALLFQFIENKKIFLNPNYEKLAFRYFIIGSVLTYFLSTLWSTPGGVYNIIGMIGVFFQGAGLYCMLRILVPAIRQGVFSHRLSIALVNFSLIAFCTKIFLQLISVFQQVALIAYRNKNFIIAYLHLVLIGFLSVFLIAFFIDKKMFCVARISKGGLFLFVLGFVVTEIFLVAQSTIAWANLPPIPFLNALLFVSSCVMEAGLLFCVFPQLQNTITDYKNSKNYSHENSRHQLF